MSASASMTDRKPMSRQSEQRQRNARLGWILASVALVFFVGFVVKIAWLGH